MRHRRKRLKGLKNSKGGEDPESNSPIAGARKKSANAGVIRSFRAMKRYLVADIH
jgi:hypothetical protein